MKTFYEAVIIHRMQFFSIIFQNVFVHGANIDSMIDEQSVGSNKVLKMYMVKDTSLHV